MQNSSKLYSCDAMSHWPFIKLLVTISKVILLWSVYCRQADEQTARSRGGAHRQENM